MRKPARQLSRNVIDGREYVRGARRGHSRRPPFGDCMNSANMPVAKKLYLAFGIVIAVLIALGIAFYTFFSSVMEANGWNVHTYQVIDESRALTESLVNMET